MQYIFGRVTRNGVSVENVKIVGEEHSNLSGHTTVTREYDDSFITDTFDVVRKYRSTEADGLYYDWYEIDNHYRYEDRHTPQICITEQEITEQEIATMEAEQLITDLDIRVMELELG